MGAFPSSISFTPIHAIVDIMVKFDKLPTKHTLEESEGADSAMASDSEDIEATNGKAKIAEEHLEGSSKRKRKSKSRSDKANGLEVKKKRRHSVSKPARDPRDQASPLSSEPDVVGTRSPSPVIDFDGLSKPSM